MKMNPENLFVQKNPGSNTGMALSVSINSDHDFRGINSLGVNRTCLDASYASLPLLQNQPDYLGGMKNEHSARFPQ